MLERLAWPGEGAIAPTRVILGRRAEDFGFMASSAAVRLTDPERFHSVQPGATRVPAFVEGSIAPGTGPDPEFQHLAVTVNGIVRSLARPSNFQAGSLSASWKKSGNGRPGTQDDMARDPAGPRQLHFTAYLPSEHLSKGRNDIGVYGVMCRDPGEACRLATLESSEQN
jgi:hypothetical protein